MNWFSSIPMTMTFHTPKVAVFQSRSAGFWGVCRTYTRHGAPGPLRAPRDETGTDPATLLGRRHASRGRPARRRQLAGRGAATRGALQRQRLASCASCTTPNQRQRTSRTSWVPTARGGWRVAGRRPGPSCSRCRLALHFHQAAVKLARPNARKRHAKARRADIQHRSRRNGRD